MIGPLGAPFTAPDATLKWKVIDRALALLGDALVVGIFLAAVALGLLDRNAAIAMVGYGLRSLVDPSIIPGRLPGSYGTGPAMGPPFAAAPPR